MTARPPHVGLIAATHTPFHDDGSLNLSVVERQAEKLLEDGVSTVFVGGTTGESASLTVEERVALARRWADVARGTPVRVIVHVGANCLADAGHLAADAGRLGVDAIAALAPSYFKPASEAALIACCAEIASAAPGLPFFYYDIPSLTGLRLSMPRLLERVADGVPTFAGLKFTNPDLIDYQRCRRVAAGRWELLWGVDELLLPATALGAVGAVGSTYNFAAPWYREMLAAAARHDHAAAAEWQFRCVDLVDALVPSGYMAAAKWLMARRGVPVGPPRLPNTRLTPEEEGRLAARVERFGLT